MVIVPQSQPAGATTLFSTSNKTRHPERSAALIYRMAGGLWRGIEEPVPSVAEGTPAMLVGRCSSELSNHELEAKLAKSQASSEAEGYAVRRTRLERPSTECAELLLVVPMNCHPDRL